MLGCIRPRLPCHNSDKNKPKTMKQKTGVLLQSTIQYKILFTGRERLIRTRLIRSST